MSKVYATSITGQPGCISSTRPRENRICRPAARSGVPYREVADTANDRNRNAVVNPPSREMQRRRPPPSSPRRTWIVVRFPIHGQYRVEVCIGATIPVVFAPEIRRGLEKLGRTGSYIASDQRNLNITEIVNVLVAATSRLSDRKHGALIVIRRYDNIQEYIQTGCIVFQYL